MRWVSVLPCLWIHEEPKYSCDGNSILVFLCITSIESWSLLWFSISFLHRFASPLWWLYTHCLLPPKVLFPTVCWTWLDYRSKNDVISDYDLSSLCSRGDEKYTKSVDLMRGMLVHLINIEWSLYSLSLSLFCVNSYPRSFGVLEVIDGTISENKD